MFCTAGLAEETGTRTTTTQPVSAEKRSEEPNTDDSDIEESSSLISNMMRSLDRKHNEWSSSLEYSAQRIDAFFADDRAFEDANETRGQITAELVKAEGEAVLFDLRVRAKLRLPHTSKKMRLLIESDPEELGQEQTLNTSAIGAVEETKFNLALETLLQGHRAWNVSPALGIASGWPPDLYARVRAVRYFDLLPWLARFSSSLSWFAVAGPIAKVGLDFNRQLTPELLLRASPNVKWSKDKDAGENTEANLSLTLYQKLANNRSLAYSARANADSDEGWDVHSYDLGVAYRKAMYKEWLYGEVNPAVTFERETNWDDSWKLTLRLEALFGRDYR